MAVTRALDDVDVVCPWCGTAYTVVSGGIQDGRSFRVFTCATHGRAMVWS